MITSQVSCFLRHGKTLLERDTVGELTLLILQQTLATSDLSTTRLQQQLADAGNKTCQSNFTKGRIAAAHGRFSHIRQVAPMFTPIYYMVPCVHPTQHPE